MYHRLNIQKELKEKPKKVSKKILIKNQFKLYFIT